MSLKKEGLLAELKDMLTELNDPDRIGWAFYGLIFAVLLTVFLVIKDWGKPRPYACACKEVTQTK